MFNKLRNKSEAPASQPASEIFKPGEAEAFAAISAARRDLQRAEAESRETMPDSWKRLDEWSAQRGATEPFNFSHQNHDMNKRKNIDPKKDAQLAANINMIMNNMREAGSPVIAAAEAVREAEAYARNLDDNLAAEKAAQEAHDAWTSGPAAQEAPAPNPSRHDTGGW